MELPAAYAVRFQPTKRHPGQPRSNREALLLPFKTRLNDDRRAAGYTPYSDAHIAKLFAGVPEEKLHPLFVACKGAEKFGGLLKWKLAELQPKRV